MVRIAIGGANRDTRLIVAHRRVLAGNDQVVNTNSSLFPRDYHDTAKVGMHWGKRVWIQTSALRSDRCGARAASGEPVMNDRGVSGRSATGGAPC